MCEVVSEVDVELSFFVSASSPRLVRTGTSRSVS